MDHGELLAHLATTFDRLGLRYGVTGSTATIFYGEPRFTNDIDVVVDLPADRIDDLLAAFPDNEYYVSRSAVESAVARRGQFNIIHPKSGLKADVIVATNSEFDRRRLARAQPVTTSPGHSVLFAAPEDVILKKLQYFRDGGSEKHLRDIAGVLRVQGDRIDRDDIAEWAERLGVSEAWQLVLSRLADNIEGPDERMAG